MTLLETVAGLSPRSEPPESLVETAPFLEYDPATLAAAADGTGIAVFVFGTVAATLAGHPVFVVVAAGFGIAGVAAVRGVPLAIANARRSRALGEAPALVGRAVLRVRITPTAERAAVFATDRDGPLGESLSRHVRSARGTPRSGFERFAEMWREFSPALHRAVLLVEAAAGAPDDERDRTLDRAMDAVLDGTHQRAASAADSLRGPATAVYAFGVLLPLALVGVLPAAGAAGIEATPLAVVVVYDLLLPVVLFVAAGWLLANRPVAFPPAQLGRDTAGLSSRWWLSLAAGVSVAAVAWIGTGIALPGWTRPLAAIGCGSGVALVVYHRPVVSARERIDALEAALPDALYLIGRRVTGGVAVERAIEETAEELDAPADTVFAEATRRQKQLRVGVGEAFNGEYGALTTLPSPRAESAAELLAIAAREGPPAGRALVETADHLEDLREVERAARRDLGRVTATLANTAAVFGPLVGGSTVALADGVGTTDALDAPPTAGLGIAIGIYVLLLAVVLTALSVGLSRGFDRVTIGYRVGVAVIAATTIYLVSFGAVARLAGGL